MTDKQELTPNQEHQLIHLLDFFQDYGITMSAVSERTELARTSLTGAFKGLEAKYNKQPAPSPNRFKQSDYQKLVVFLGKLKASADRIHTDMLLNQ